MSPTPYHNPTSLPSKCALAPHCASNHSDEGEINWTESEDDEASFRAYPRLSSGNTFLPSSPLGSPTILYPNGLTNGYMPGSHLSENTPLLNPLSPHPDEASAQSLNGSSRVIVFWEEIGILTRYALPVFGTHVLEFSLIMASVVSIGHISTTALAAISLGTMTANVTAFSIIQGFASALDTMLPSAWTSSQPQLVGLWTQRMVVVITVLLIPIYSTWFNAETILLSLNQEPEVARLAALYLRWISIGLPAYAFNCVSRRYFQSQGLFAIPTKIIFIVAPINAALNYLLVWGPPAIRLGFIGAPIATAVSFNLVSMMSLVYGVIYVPRTAWYPLSRGMFTSLGILVHLGLAGVGQTASEWWAWEFLALTSSLLGPVSLATQSILLSSASSTFQAPFALSMAVSVRIGNLLGEGRAQRAGITSNTSIIMALVLSAASSTTFMVFRKQWGIIFNNDPEVVGLVASIIPLLALVQAFDGNSAVTAGILRARGKQVTGALLNLSSYYILGIPFGLYLAFKCDMGLQGLWIGLAFSLVYTAFFGTLLCVRTDWDHEVWKVTQRLKEEQGRFHTLDEECGQN